MKKVSIFLMLLISIVSCLFAWQETYSAESIEYKQMQAFARILGTSIPTPTAPITGSQMLLFLEHLPAQNLDANTRSQFDSLVASLTSPAHLITIEPDVFSTIFLSVNPQGFYHSNTETDIDDWLYPYRDWQPIINAGGEFWFGKNLYAMSDFNFSLRKFSYKYDNANFFWNGLTSIAEFELALPSKAYTSIGTDSLNLIAGRDKLSSGNGVTSNLFIGDGLWWKDFVKLSVARATLSYDFTLIGFDRYKNYEKDPLTLEEFDFNSEHKIVVVHRFSWSPWKWFNFSLTEGALQYGSNILDDVRLVNPFLMIHGTNGYVKGTQNNFFGFELQFLPIDGLELNFDAIFDQIQVPAELDNGKPYDNTPPNAYGFLLNAKYSLPLEKGIATFYAEAVYTSPCLYLKAGTKGYNFYDTNLIVGNALWNKGNSDLSYLGYKYGPDTIVVALGGEYTQLDGFTFGVDILFKAHGEHGIRNRINQTDELTTGMAHFYDVSPTYTEGKTLPEYRLGVSGYVEMRILKWLDFTGNVAFVRDWNHYNVIGADFFDVQLALGVKIHTV